MERLNLLTVSTWTETVSSSFQTHLTQSLEQGQVLFMPQLAFDLHETEHQFLTPDIIDPKSKNISFNKLTNEVRGIAKQYSSPALHQFLQRFADQAHQFVNRLFPHYANALKIGRTSFRPVEISGRKSSYRKDDTRLHVDAFPANPNHGWRILRVFCNIHLQGKARVWRLGEPFEQVAQQFVTRLKKPIPGSAPLLHLLKITKKRRTLYDHYMLQLHDNMKADEHYQKTADQQEFHFPSQTTWIVQTDHVSHAAMSGQHLLEQTFYLPVTAMQNQNHAPLRVLEKLMQQRLV